MKTTSVTISLVMATSFVFSLLSSCDSDPDAPDLSTLDVHTIAQTTAVCGGVIRTNGVTVTARGVCWSVTPNPTTSDSKTVDGAGSGSFSSNLTGLSGGTTYYVSSYATHSGGTTYGDQKEFTTVP